MKKYLFFVFFIVGSLSAKSIMPLENFNEIETNSVAPLPDAQPSLESENGIWVFDCGPTNPLVWQISVAAKNENKVLAFKWNAKNETWLSASLNFTMPIVYENKNAVSFAVRSKKPVSLELSLRAENDSGEDGVFSFTIENINSAGAWTNIVVSFSDLFLANWYKKENPEKDILEQMPESGLLLSVSISPAWNSAGECEIDNIALFKSEKTVCRNPYLIDDFSGYPPKKIKAGFAQQKEHISNDKKWVFGAGPKEPIKWDIIFARKKTRGKNLKFMIYDWNNKSSTWLSASCYFKRPVLPPACNALAFLAHTSGKKKVDVTIVLANEEETPYQSSVKIPGEKKGWENIVVPFNKFSVPKWFSGTNKVEQPIFPTNFPILAISISPAWNTAGKIAIDNIVWTNIKVSAVKQVKLKNKKRVAKFNKIKNYACYYGNGKLKEMSHFDAVIFEPKNFTKREIAKLKKTGTITIGYVTIGEDDDFHKGADWYFDRNKDGKPDKNEIWNSWYADARSKKWRDYVVNDKAKKILVDKKCDGIFLDTVDTAQLYPESETGMIQLIKELREKYPKAIIVQNRGFTVINKTAEFVDGLMYEAFSSHINFETEEYAKVTDADINWSKKMAENTLAPIMKKTGLTVLALDYAEPEQKNLIQFDYSRARYYGFIPYVATIALDEIFVRKVKETPYTPPVNQKTFIQKNPVNGNLCRKNKVKIKVDSSFLGYSPNALTDGYRQEKELNWYERAWASAEYPGEHFVEISFPKEQTVSNIFIYWSIEENGVMASKQLNIFADSRSNQIATIVPEKLSNSSPNPISVIKISPPVKAKKFIFLQPEGKGPAGKPDIIWISEIEMY